MPTRSIKLKLIVPRGPEARHARQALWTTHREINHAVHYYEQMLLTMRGEAYTLPNGEIVTEETVKGHLQNLIREAYARNGRVDELSDEDIIAAQTSLRALYEAIIPSSIGEKGNAQNANAFLSPLTDNASQGLLAVFDKIVSPPPWLDGVRNGEADAFDAANKWLESEDGQGRLRATGAPPTWVRQARAGSQDWTVSFVKDFDNKVKEAEGVPTIVRNLKDKGVLPIFAPYMTPRLVSAQGELSRWDRLAFRLAAAHLLSWETWCRKSAEEFGKRSENVETFTRNHLSNPEIQAHVSLLRRYESERQTELNTIALAMDRPFRITRRMIRGWADLRDKWCKARDCSEIGLKRVIADEQTRLRGRFGDPNLFAWLAKPENHQVWTGPRDPLTLLATRNALEALLARSRPTASMTLPDAFRHPRSVQWEAEGGSNLKTYHVAFHDGALTVWLPLLTATENNLLQEEDHSFTAAPSGQLLKPVFQRRGNKLDVSYESSSGDVFTGQMGATDLLFDWNWLRHKAEDRVAGGYIGPVYLKLSIDLSPQLPDGWTERQPKMVSHFLSAIGNNKYQSDVVAGLRVLSVDMGLRSFASCSVFELKEGGGHDDRLSFPVDCSGLSAVHERSFILRLPGEEVDRSGQEWRIAQRGELRLVRQGLSRYRRLYALDKMDKEEDRRELIETLNSQLFEGSGWPFEVDILTIIANHLVLDDEQWLEFCSAQRRNYRNELGKVIGTWRRQSRKRWEGGGKGKSMWAIEFLTDVRRFLVGWSLTGRASGEINRLDRENRGVFASRLLDHIQGIKDDRLKTGADLIVQAARGFLRDNHGQWKMRYAPCQMVLFEDLSRYRMKTDRPRRENSLLMRWAHRSIPDEVKIQGQIFGINVCDTAAAFSSRYHARTNAPGIRCHPVKAEDLNDGFFMDFLARENPGLDAASLKPGDLVPLGGGEMFVFLNNDKTHRVHADINAAQNLQRRFWARHADAFRLPCRKVIVNGTECWLPRSLGKRLRGSLGGFGWLIPTGHASGSCRWETLTPKRWRTLGGETVEDESLVQDDPMDGVVEDILETSGEVTVFFRDPSGHVLPKGLWYPGKEFWGMVKAKTSAAVRQQPNGGC